MARATFTASPNKKTGQEARRLRRRFTDQHGRLWSAEVDVKMEKPDACSPFEPIKIDANGECIGAWKAPYMPEQKYLSIDPQDDRLLKIDYERALTDLEESQKERDRDLNRYALAMYTEPEERAKAIENPTRALLDLLGPKPMHPNVIKAAMVGHKWTIGVPGEPRPSWADEYFPKPVRRTMEALASDDFVKQLRAELATADEE
jgi:hypothetical protein